MPEGVHNTAHSALKLLSGELVRRVVAVLAPLSIPVMPLKGALWQATLYEAHEARPLIDVDLLVPVRRFDDALVALAAAGFAPRPEATLAMAHEDFASADAALSAAQLWRDLRRGFARERELHLAGLPLVLDLHRSLFARGRYDLTTGQLFARATLDVALFGVPVWIPHPLDQLAHLLGHLATDHRLGDETYRADFARLLERTKIVPEVAARHFEEHGLARAVRFALPELAGSQHQAWLDRCLDALKPDPFGDILAKRARAVVARNGRHSLTSSLAGHGLNRDLRQIVAALSWATLARVRARLL